MLAAILANDETGAATVAGRRCSLPEQYPRRRGAGRGLAWQKLLAVTQRSIGVGGAWVARPTPTWAGNQPTARSRSKTRDRRAGRCFSAIPCRQGHRKLRTVRSGRVMVWHRAFPRRQTKRVWAKAWASAGRDGYIVDATEGGRTQTPLPVQIVESAMAADDAGGGREVQRQRMLRLGFTDENARLNAAKPAQRTSNGDK